MTDTKQTVDETTYDYITNKWSRTIIQPILIALMTTALFVAIFSVFTIFSPDPVWYLLTPLFLIVTLEGVYTTIWLSQPGRRTLNRTYYQVSELLLILLVTRIYTWAIADAWPDPQLLADYLRAPWLLVNDGLFLITMVAIIIAWLRARILSRTFTDLALDRAEVVYYTTPPNKRDPGNQPTLRQRRFMTETFFSHWIWGGIFVIICVAVSSVDLQNTNLTDLGIGIARLGLHPLLVLAVLLYFLSGLALLSEARLEMLNAHWLHEGAQRAPEIEKKWHQFGIWFLILVGMIATLLPLGSSSLIGHVLEQFVLVIVNVLSIITGLITFLIAIVFSFLFPQSSPEPEVTAIPTAVPTPAPQPTPIPTVPPVVNDTPALVISSLFWALLLVGVVMAFLFFIRGRGVKIDGRIFNTIFISIRHFLADLFSNVAEQFDGIGDALQTRLQLGGDDKEEDGKGKRPFRFFRLNSLNPQEQVRYFYLSTVKRAQDKGVARDKNETPLEFLDDLKESWPEAEEEIDTLTDAFLKARYSPRPIEKEDVNPIKAQWKKAKARLRKRAQKKDDS